MLKIFVLLSFFTHPLMASEKLELPRAKVIFVRGKVTIGDPVGNYREARKGEEWFAEETLKTGDSSLAIIALNNGSKARIEANTVVHLESLHAEYAGENLGETSILLKAGGLLIDFVNKRKEPILEVKTDRVALGIRGTNFYVGLSENEGKEHLMTSVSHGEIEIQHLTDKDKADLLEAGHGMILENGHEFTQPQKYDWVKKMNFDADNRNVESHETRQLRHREHLKEFRKKRQLWKRNHERFKQKRQQWQKAREMRQQRHAKLQHRFKKIKEHWSRLHKERKQKLSQMIQNKMQDRKKLMLDRQSQGQKKAGQRQRELELKKQKMQERKRRFLQDRNRRMRRQQRPNFPPPPPPGQ